MAFGLGSALPLRTSLDLALGCDAEMHRNKESNSDVEAGLPILGCISWSFNFQGVGSGVWVECPGPFHRGSGSRVQCLLFFHAGAWGVRLPAGPKDWLAARNRAAPRCSQLSADLTSCISRNASAVGVESSALYRDCPEYNGHYKDA